MTALLVVGVVSGCGIYPPPAIPDVVSKQIYEAGHPVALVTFAPGMSSGKIMGIVRGWPFPKLERHEGIPGGTFTFVGDFKVTTRSPEDAMPNSAAGARKVYFRESEAPSSFDADSLSRGQPVAIDALSMTFAFKSNPQAITVRINARQISAQRFTYQSETIAPPRERNTSELLGGQYNPEYNGFVLYTITD